MRAKGTIEPLERRVEALEKEVLLLRRDPSIELERARNLIFNHLKEHDSIEPVRFAAQNDLSLAAVEEVLREFDKKNWTVPFDDEEA